MYEFLEYRVDDFMTFPVVMLEPGATLADAQRIFDERDFNCIPVAAGARLQGVLTKLDFLRAFAFPSRELVPPYGEILQRSVASLMTTDPVTIPAETALTAVIQKMVLTHRRSIPVLRGGEVVGIISREDVIRALECAAAGEDRESVLRGKRPGHPQPRSLVREVVRRIGCERRQAEGLVFAVFQELRDRLTTKEAADVAAQLPEDLRRMWRENERPERAVRRIGKEEFLGRVRRRANLADDVEAEHVVRVVFRGLQHHLGSATGREGEAWDVFSQLPKALKVLWLDAGAGPGA
jgi:uncharacterized protein (DUF2267 family)/CBS domain-containing protein